MLQWSCTRNAVLPLSSIVLPRNTSLRVMSTRPTHEERTAAEQRESGVHPVHLRSVEQVNKNVRILQLESHLPCHVTALTVSRNVQRSL